MPPPTFFPKEIEVRVLEQIVHIEEIHFWFRNIDFRMLVKYGMKCGRTTFHCPADNEIRKTSVLGRDPIPFACDAHKPSLVGDSPPNIAITRAVSPCPVRTQSSYSSPDGVDAGISGKIWNM